MGRGAAAGAVYAAGVPWLTVRPMDAGTGTSTGTGDTTTTGEEENVSTTLGVLYNPSEKLSLGLNLAEQTYNVTGGQGYLPDSRETTETLFATYKIASAWSAMFSAESDKEIFTTAGQGPVTNRIYTGSLNYQPEKSRWDAALQANLQSGSSPTYIMFGDRQPYVMVPTALTDVSTRVDYKLSENSTAFGTLEVSKFDSGYSSFVKDEAEIGWDQKLGKIGDRPDF